MANRKAQTKVYLLVFIGFLCYLLLSQYAKKPLKVALDQITAQGLTSYIIAYFAVGIPIFFVVFLLDGKQFLRSLGLRASVLTGIWTSIVFTLPMFMGGMFCFSLSQDWDIENLLAGTLVAGFMEELYFRGFFFGLLFKKTRLGFIPAIFLGAILFATAHLHQSEHIPELIGIFIMTFLGAIFFAWLYVEWNNLWVPILTHTGMNLSWVLFAVDDTALGNLQANVFRLLTIATCILLTIFYKKKKGEKLVVNKHTLFLKKTPNE